jgi:hypothetical protein
MSALSKPNKKPQEVSAKISHGKYMKCMKLRTVHYIFHCYDNFAAKILDALLNAV